MTVEELRRFLEHKAAGSEVVVRRAYRTPTGNLPSKGQDMEVVFAEDSDEIRLIVHDDED